MAPFKLFLMTAVLFILLEGLVFRTGFYARYIEPSSSAGMLESTLHNERTRPLFGRDEVLVTGDSRIAEGFSNKVANNSCTKGDYYFGCAAVPGATPRCLFYLLRDLDPTRKRYRAIVLGVEDYDDANDYEDLADRLGDLHYCIIRLRYSDIFEFASSFSTARRRFEAFRGSLFKGITLQPDLLAFLEQGRKRLSDAAAWREHGREWSYDYQGHESDVDGINVDWEKRAIEFPAKVPVAVRQSISDKLFGPIAPQSRELGKYRLLWFGRILDLYRNSNTKLIFLEFPRGPVVPPVPRVQPLSHSIRDLGRNRGAILLPDNLFEPLERGRFYFDSAHLNAQGRVQFSRMLANSIRATLGPSRN
jgi:hypothetical protein